MQRSFTAKAVALCCFWAGIVACSTAASGDEDGDDGGGNGTGFTTGTCDFRDVEGYAPTCTEFDIGLDEIPGFRESCVTEGGSWTNAPCPSENQFGCCSYVEGDWGFRECRYAENPDRITREDLCADEASCTGLYEGVYTPGPAFDCSPRPPTAECQQLCSWLAMVCPADITDLSVCHRSCVTYFYEEECPSAFAALARCMQQTPASSVICNGLNPYLGDPDPCQQQTDALVACIQLQ